MKAQERAKLESEARRTFEAALRDARTFLDARRLVDSAPVETAPGRRLYSNLGFFLLRFDLPDGADVDELALYRDFIVRLDATGALKAGEADRIVRAIDAKAPVLK